MKKTRSLIDTLQDALDYQSGFTSDEDKTRILVEACKGFLRSLNYRIIDPPRLRYRQYIKDINDLILLFYEGVDNRGANEFVLFREESRDKMIASEFVESRMQASGIDRKEAIAECAEIIHTILEDQLDGIKALGELKLSFTLFRPSEKTAWLIERTIEVMNSKKYRVNKALCERVTEDYLNEIGEESLAWEDLDEVYEEVVNGKEKTN